MEDMMSKNPDSAKMKARYHQYLKKRTIAVQIIQNALEEKELMVEIMAQGQNIGLNHERRSLKIQQNPGLSNLRVFSQPHQEGNNTFITSLHEHTTHGHE